MIANVRRRWIWAARSVMAWASSLGLRRGHSPQREFQHRGVLAAVDGLIVAAAHADLLEAERLVQTDRHGVGRTHLEKGLGHGGSVRALEQAHEDLLARAAAAERLRHAQVENVRLAGPDAHDAVTADLASHGDDTADITDPQAVAKDALAPGKLVGGPLDRHDLEHVRRAHRADEDFLGA